MNAVVRRGEDEEVSGHIERRGTILVSVHEFGGMDTIALLTVIGDLGNTRKQAEVHGGSIREAMVSALETLFEQR